MATKSKKRFVVVTTDSTRRGVFAGLLVKWDRAKQVAILEQAQMCIYWSKATMGVLGLAADGPQPGSRVGKPVPQIELNGVTSVIDATTAARELWEKTPWSA